MYDCAELMKIKLNALRMLGVNEELMKLYCPGEPPSQELESAECIREIAKELKFCSDRDMLCDLSSLMNTVTACPYCYAATCNTCRYADAFGDYNSERHDKLKYLLEDAEVTEPLEPVIEYLNKEYDKLVKRGE